MSGPDVTLPRRCPYHPDAPVHHVRDAVYTTEMMIDESSHYYCVICGTEVASPRQPPWLGGEK